jgi:hypothetical protein
MKQKDLILYTEQEVILKKIKISMELVELSLQTDPCVKITAQTLPQNNYSTCILEKNNFKFTETANDPEDGNVWEWEFIKK